MSVPSISPAVGSMPPARAVTLPPPSSTSMGTTNSTAPPSSGSATILSVSTPAQLMAKMRQLALTNPEEFKLLASEMGGAFARAAGLASGTDAQLLAKVASQFTLAASSGSLTAPDAIATAASTRAVEGTSAVSSGDAFSSASGNRHGHQAARDASAWSSSAVQQAFGQALAAFDQATGSETPS
jgi:hypothetical protein